MKLFPLANQKFKNPNKQLLKTKASLIYHLLALWKSTWRAFPFYTSQIYREITYFSINKAYPLYFSGVIFSLLTLLFIKLFRPYQWWIQGREPGPPPPPHILRPYWGPKGKKKNFFGDPPPPPVSQGLDQALHIALQHLLSKWNS